MLNGPQPQSDREYLIRIFATTQTIQTSVEDLCTRVDRQDTRLKELETWHTTVRDDCTRHTRQITSLEEWRNRAIGAVAVVVALAGTIVATVKGWL